MALKQGYKVYYTSVMDLMEQLNVATTTGMETALYRKLLKQDVIILDELGYLKINRAQGNFLFRLISKFYEHASLIITTNKDFSGWSEFFDDSALVSAMLDRLLHHCRIFKISFRCVEFI